MAREIDERKTKRALNRLQRARAEAEARGEALSEWEEGFIESVETRLKTFGSAFCDPEKGDLSEPLSGRQRQKMREIDRKARGRDRQDGDNPENTEEGDATRKPRKTLQARKPMNRVSAKRAGARTPPRVRDIAQELEDELAQDAPRHRGPPTLRVIDGGAS